MNTPTLKPTDITRKWHLVDLDGQTLGRVATSIATLLMGKGKVISGNHLDNGDYVVAINSDKIKVTGKKLTDKIYYSHSGFPGGLKELSLSQLMAKDSRKVIEKAVKGMLPKDKHQQDRLRRLKLFADAKHPYANELGLNKKSE
ncbi:MAG TPA: 50S ribosomal protein L13 [Patescibacteria group bacterium]